MGGLGIRFESTILKPFILINDKPMFRWAEQSAMNFLSRAYPDSLLQFFGCIRFDEIPKVSKYLTKYNSLLKLVPLPHQTAGPAESVYLSDINGAESLVIHDCDLVAWPGNYKNHNDSDLEIYFTKSSNPQHSFINIEKGFVTRIEEKKMISNLGVVGIYYFRTKTLFDHLYEKTDFDEGHYISNVVKTALKLKYKVVAKEVGSCLSMGTPAEVSENLERINDDYFLRLK